MNFLFKGIQILQLYVHILYSTLYPVITSMMQLLIVFTVLYKYTSVYLSTTYYIST